MLQRIQTIYLLIVGVLIIGLYFWFSALNHSAENTGFTNNSSVILLVIGGMLLLCVSSILKYKKRKLQFVLNRLNIILNFILLGVFVYQILTISGEINISKKGIGVFIPIISIVFLVLANKAIKKDEDLVKSVDRLR